METTLEPASGSLYHFNGFWRGAGGLTRLLLVGGTSWTIVFIVATLGAIAQIPASVPPMGWNSWDSYGLTITEDQYLANVKVLSKLRRYGWSYAVIDEGWYLGNPLNHPKGFLYTYDQNGRLTPALGRFPSAANGAGFKPLADQTHVLGLKFGIHIIRGIPKEAVRDNLPIAGSSFSAAEAGDTGDTCPWNSDNFGVKDNPAGQAYYDSIIRLYAGWGVDFIKVDCISDHPYRPVEIRMIATAIQKTGRPIVLSLSPGPTNLSHAEEVSRCAQMWRISDDLWDGWQFPRAPGLLSAFDNLAKWSQYASPGHWPDADMLPWGSLSPQPGSGRPRKTRLTEEEIRTQFTLWAIARTPMFLGANLTELDPFTLSLLRNRDVIAINQTATTSSQISSPDESSMRVWSASIVGHSPRRYIAIFNLKDAPVSTDITWSKLLGRDWDQVRAWDVWKARHLRPNNTLHLELVPHGCALFRIENASHGSIRMGRD